MTDRLHYIFPEDREVLPDFGNTFILLAKIYTAH